ncbi:MAG: alkaline phosphatase family protein [Planctomycetes bacterium]|nr:alkaline phosphatase family protein [Planctomycetota bacterium]
MTAPIVVICCVGLTSAHLGSDTPNLTRLADAGFTAPLAGVLPAVTTTAQTTMITGVLPREHGIVANGWYFREIGEVWLWRQSQKLVQAPSCWEIARRSRPGLKVLKHFWWYAMNTDVDATVTPRPVYHHDGRKSPDIYASPTTLKDELSARHGAFPLFNFWGPMASIASTRWIAESFATAFDASRPDLAWCYLPHLDYDLQRYGPRGPHLAANLRALDTEAGKVIAHAQARGATVVVVSEYGIEPVDRAVEINRVLRRAGLLVPVRNAAGELIDTGASRAFAVCDHQLAHIYCRDDAATAAAAAALRGVEGIERVYAGGERATIGLDHPRSGELIALATPGAWFAYDYWLDDDARPDFARCVEIHKKPGYDPRELLFDPRGGKLRAAKALLRKKLGLRYLLDPIPLATALVKGSHGRAPARAQDGAIIIASDRSWARDRWSMLDIAPAIVRALGS